MISVLNGLLTETLPSLSMMAGRGVQKNAELEADVIMEGVGGLGRGR